MSAPVPDFVHLRLHSEYSVTDGIVRIDDAVARAAADGMPALALTDLGNFFGLVKFYSAARGRGSNRSLGADVWMTQRDRSRIGRRAYCCCAEIIRVICSCARSFRVPSWHRERAAVPRSRAGCWRMSASTG
jgi:hypothetical protein